MGTVTNCLGYRLDTSIFWNSQWQSAHHRALYTEVNFLHLFTDLFCKNISLLLRITTDAYHTLWPFVYFDISFHNKGHSS